MSATKVKDFQKQQPDAESWPAQEVIHWGLREFGSRLGIASSFGAEDVVLIDLASRGNHFFRVFTLDTDFLFTQTYRLIETIESRYRISVERTRPALTPEAQAAAHGEALWTREPNLCCEVRKVEPLQKHLATLDAWITGVRREQTAARANAKKIEWDARFGLLKLNPLADWTNQQVWDYIRANEVPYNPLHDYNYPSIGCTHCTRPVLPGEDPRAGRWAQFQKTECGLHARE